MKVQTCKNVNDVDPFVAVTGRSRINFNIKMNSQNERYKEELLLKILPGC